MIFKTEKQYTYICENTPPVAHMSGNLEKKIVEWTITYTNILNQNCHNDNFNI